MSKLRRRQKRKKNYNIHNCHFWADEMPLSSPKTNKKKRELMRDKLLCTNRGIQNKCNFSQFKLLHFQQTFFQACKSILSLYVKTSMSTHELAIFCEPPSLSKLPPFIRFTQHQRDKNIWLDSWTGDV